MLKKICDNVKVLKLPYVKTLLQNTTDDDFFQNSKFNYVERAKITICNNASYGPTKLLDASEVVSKMAHIKISYKQRSRF